MNQPNRKTIIFFFILTVLTVLGFFLRLIDYDRLPGWRESDDEIHYAWTGLTWLKTGVPESWSYLEIYSQVRIFNAWNVNWKLVKPMLEKPPLYSLLSGLTVKLAGETELKSVRLSTIRLLPLFLSLITIALTGIVSAQVFGKRVGLLTAFLYAMTPTIVMANRLSVTENLMVPLVLTTTSILLYGQNSSPQKLKFPLLVGFCAGLIALTKQNGLAAIISCVGLYVYFKQWRSALVCLLVSISLLSIYFFIGTYYDLPLFLRVIRELRLVGLQGGLPQLVITLLGRPLITTERLFYDGSMLMGYILLFTSPWWLVKNSNYCSSPPAGGRELPNDFSLRSKNNQALETKIISFLAFPIIYVVYLGLTITGAEPIGSGQGFWGWYAYPLFPYAVTLVAVILVQLWQAPNFFLSLVTTLILGSSTIRFFFLQLPQKYHLNWQNTLIGLFLFASCTILPNQRLRKFILLTLFLVFIGVNLYTSIFLYKIYPILPQP